MMSKYEEFCRRKDFSIPGTMQALVASGKGFGNLEVRQVPVPETGPGQLLARVDAAGVCTSLLKLIDQGPDHTFIRGWDMEKCPVVLGDEGAITLVKVGDDLKDKYSPGQRFAIQPAVDIDPINYRQRYEDVENMHKCAVGYTLGGHLAQYIVVQEEVLEGQCLLALPDEDMSYFAVSMAEPISCVYSAQQRNYHIIKDDPGAERKPQLGLLPGGVTVVIGAGAMGRMHAELALRFDPSVLIVTARRRPRLDLTEKLLQARAKAKGTELVCVTADKLSETVMKYSVGKGADDIILALSNNEVQQNAIGLLARGGVANLFGGLPRGDHMLKLDALSVHYDEIKVVGSSGGEPSDMIETLEAIETRQIDPGNYVAAVGSLDNAIEVLKMIRQGRIDGKAILYPHIKQTPLKFVEYWDKQQEMEFLNSNLI